jgi:hypothetical protein
MIFQSFAFSYNNNTKITQTQDEILSPTMGFEVV